MRNDVKRDFPAKVYPATQMDACIIASGLTGDVAMGFPEDYTVLHYVVWCPLTVAFGLVDMPFSLVFDTLLLPVDLWGPRETPTAPAHQDPAESDRPRPLRSSSR